MLFGTKRPWVPIPPPQPHKSPDQEPSAEGPCVASGRPVMIEGSEGHADLGVAVPVRFPAEEAMVAKAAGRRRDSATVGLRALRGGLPMNMQDSGRSDKTQG